MNQALQHWKARGVDLSMILKPASRVYDNTQVYRVDSQDHGLEKALDNELIKLAEPAIKRGEVVHIDLPIININRVVGTMLSHEVAKATHGKLLADDTININLTGSAGQSLGAWLAKGITIKVEGDANDFVGKGLSGGKIAIYPPKNSSFVPEENILAGNVVLYGATSGEVYLNGIAAERFCVRNSGAEAVVEGIGDHGCEYMTGGRVVVLGRTGRNFGAGMSGGVAYILNSDGDFERRCNMETLELESVQDTADILELRSLIERHYQYTNSGIAKRVLDNWTDYLGQFVKVMPTDYKRALLASREEPAAIAVNA
jgi:glutamate synthase domain-containing protein 3